MTAEERIAQLEAELAAERTEKDLLRLELQTTYLQIKYLFLYASQLEEQLLKKTHDNSELPSSN